jgi:multimeric flavodoxin WrbA
MSGERQQLLILFHSQGGTTQQLAEAALRGARREADVDARLLRAFDAGLDDLLACAALLIVTPENLGYMAGAIKDFFDRTFYPAQGRVDGLPFALLVKAGNDGSNTVVQVERIARGYRFRAVADPLVVRGETTADDLARAEELGQTLAAGLALGIF